jgi:hypothetical protein
MSSGLFSKLFPETLRSLAGTALTASHQALGSSLGNAARIVRITNTSNVEVRISWNGTDDHECVAPTSGVVHLDVSANKETSLMLEIPKGTQFFVRSPSGAGASGNVCLAVYFAY